MPDVDRVEVVLAKWRDAARRRREDRRWSQAHRSRGRGDGDGDSAGPDAGSPVSGGAAQVSDGEVRERTGVAGTASASVDSEAHAARLGFRTRLRRALLAGTDAA